MWPNPRETGNLVTFNEEILNGKLHFLCSEVKLSTWCNMVIMNLVFISWYCYHSFFWSNLVLQSEILFNIGIGIYWLRFWCLFFQNVCHSAFRVNLVSKSCYNYLKRFRQLLHAKFSFSFFRISFLKLRVRG